MAKQANSESENDARSGVERQAEAGQGRDVGEIRRLETGEVQQLRAGDIRPSYSVVETVSEATGRVLEDLQPLYDVIDPDALDEIFIRSGDQDSHLPSDRVSFKYEGCDVTIHADGRTVVSPLATEQP